MTVSIKIAGTEYKAENAAQEDTLKSIETMLKKATGNGSILDPKAQKALNKALTDQTTSTDDLTDSFDDLDDSADELNKTFDDVVDEEKKREKKRNDTLEVFKKSLAVSGIAAVSTFANGITSATKNLAQSIQVSDDTKSGVLALSRVIDTSISVVADGVASVAAAVPVVGAALAGLTQAGAEALKFANNFLATQLNIIISSYAKIGKEGTILAGGMSELQTTANKAGLGISTFSDIIAKNAEMIRASGLGMTDGVEKFGQVFNVFRNSTEGYSKKLFALGYDINDQGDIIAATMANLTRASNGQKVSAEQIAAQSYDYAKSLKIITDLTGKSADAQMKEAKEASMNLAVQAKLNTMDADARQRFSAELEATPDALKTAFKQQFATGVVSDQAGAALLGASKQAQDAFYASAAAINDSTKTSTQLTTEATSRWADVNKSLEGNNVAVAASTAALLGASGMAATLGKGFDDLNVQTNYTKKAVQDVAAAEDQLTNHTDKLTNNFADLSDKMLTFQAVFENIAIPAVKEYSDILKKEAEMIQGLLQKAEDATKPGGAVDKAGGVVDSIKSFANDLWDRLSDDALKKDTRDVWSWVKAAVTDPNNVPQFADGGVAAGPTSGYTATLHGTEAVVPLPNGNSIPVDFNMDQLDKNPAKDNSVESNTIKDNKSLITTLQQLLNAQENGNDIDKQMLGMTGNQTNMIAALAKALQDNNTLLAKIYKTGY